MFAVLVRSSAAKLSSVRARVYLLSPERVLSGSSDAINGPTRRRKDAETECTGCKEWLGTCKAQAFCKDPAERRLGLGNNEHGKVRREGQA